jgi:hypothetical protein
LASIIILLLKVRSAAFFFFFFLRFELDLCDEEREGDFAEIADSLLGGVLHAIFGHIYQLAHSL